MASKPLRIYNEMIFSLEDSITCRLNIAGSARSLN